MTSWYGKGDYDASNYGTAVNVSFTGLSATSEFSGVVSKFEQWRKFSSISARNEFGSTLGYFGRGYALTAGAARLEYLSSVNFEIDHVGPKVELGPLSAGVELGASLGPLQALVKTNLGPLAARIELGGSVAFGVAYKLQGASGALELRSGAVLGYAWSHLSAPGREPPDTWDENPNETDPWAEVGAAPDPWNLVSTN